MLIYSFSYYTLSFILFIHFFPHTTHLLILLIHLSYSFSYLKHSIIHFFNHSLILQIHSSYTFSHFTHLLILLLKTFNNPFLQSFSHPANSLILHILSFYSITHFPILYTFTHSLIRQIHSSSSLYQKKVIYLNYGKN